MSVMVRYFASMRDRMGRAEEAVALDDKVMTVASLWKKISEPSCRKGLERGFWRSGDSGESRRH